VIARQPIAMPRQLISICDQRIRLIAAVLAAAPDRIRDLDNQITQAIDERDNAGKLGLAQAQLSVNDVLADPMERKTSPPTKRWAIGAPANASPASTAPKAADLKAAAERRRRNRFA
jgi:hypothetical protein